MIAELSYLIARAMFHVRREVSVGIGRAEMNTTISCPPGISACGNALDDHPDITCDEEMLPTFPIFPAWDQEDDEQ